MFGWHKPTAPPTTSGANPGKAVKASIAFANGGRTWKEESACLPCAERMVRQKRTAGGMGKIGRLERLP